MPITFLMINLAVAWLCSLYFFTKAVCDDDIDTVSGWDIVTGVSMFYVTLTTPFYYAWYLL